MLFLVQDDAEWIAVKRRGRFSIETDAAASEPHLLASIKDMQERMIAGLAKAGYEYMDGGLQGFEIRGPLPHIEFSDDVSADPGSPPPDPRDVDHFNAWERAEKARTAHKLGENVDRIDFELVAPFRHRIPKQFHWH